MPRTPAKTTQADVARTIRAAMQAGAAAVEVRTDGSMLVHLTSAPSSQSPLKPMASSIAADDDERVIVL